MKRTQAFEPDKKNGEKHHAQERRLGAKYLN